MQPTPEDRDFAGKASLQSYLVAAFQLAYAIVYLGFARPHPEDNAAAALADALIAAAGLSATIAIVGACSRIRGDSRFWLMLFGVGWALLSATHGAYAALAEAQRLPVGDLSATDPRGFATFGLAGLWTLTMGLVIRGGAGALPSRLGTLAIIDGIDLIALFLATAADQQTPILITGGLASVILGPAFWIWMGRSLGRGSPV